MRPLIAATLLLLITSSCKKADDSTKNNTWKLGTKTYTVNRYAKTTNDFQAFDDEGNGVTFFFASFPTVDGLYNVVSNSASLEPGNVHVVALVGATGSSYFASGCSPTVATVKIISPTRLAVSLPTTWVVRNGNDSLKLLTNVGDL